MKKKGNSILKRKQQQQTKHPDVIKTYHAQANRKIVLSASISSVD